MICKFIISDYDLFALTNEEFCESLRLERCFIKLPQNKDSARKCRQLTYFSDCEFEGESMKDWYKGLLNVCKSKNSAICGLNKLIIQDLKQKDKCMFNEICILLNKRSLVYNSVKNEIHNLIYEIIELEPRFQTNDKAVEYLL